MGIVLNIMKYAIHDGPGIRVTVFLKGCPLSCHWCHNPESISPQPELLFYQDRCLNCGQCGSQNDDEFSPNINYLKTCPGGAMEIAGREMSVKEVINEVEKDAVFFEESGGGVTFSGGEPLMQPDFLFELLKEAQKRDIHRVIDTSGFAPLSVVERIAPLVNLWLFDLKHLNNDTHKYYTGVYNQQIIANLRWLSEHNYPLNIRIPIIPGVNDKENINATISFLQTLTNKAPITLLPYHKIGSDKYKRCNRTWKMSNTEPPSKEAMEQISSYFKEAGFIVTE